MCADHNTYTRVSDIIKNHYAQLKEIFITATIKFGYPPDFSKDAVYKFLEMTGMIDGKVLHRGIVDTYFKAANYESVDSLHNDDTALCRFEFLEFICRIAKAKLFDTGIVDYLSVAVLRLFNVYILPMRNNLITWQAWREEELWCREVDEELEVN